MWACPLVAASRTCSHLNWKEGTALMKGAWTPSRKVTTPKAPQGIKCCTQTPFLDPHPFNWWYGIENVARVRVNGKSCMALLDNGAQINTIMLGFVEDHSLDMGPVSELVGGWVTCVGTYPPYGLCSHMGSSRWSPGLWWWPDIPGNPGFVQFCSMDPHDLHNPPNKPYHECDKGDRDRQPSDTMDKHPGGLSFGSWMGYSHSGRWQGCCWNVRPYWDMTS